MNKFWLLLLILLMLSFIPVKVEAATTADVIVTAHGYVVGSPSGLVISYTGEDYVDISWVKGALANNTMIRVGHTGYPTSLTDGGLVYYGNGTTTQYVINYERLLANEEYEGLYFIAWSQNAAGAWEMIGATTGASAFWEDVNLLFVIICLIVLTLTFFAFRLKNVGLSIISAFGWAGLAIHQLNLYYTLASISGVEPLIGYTCVVMCMAMFFAPIMFVRKPKVVLASSSVGVMDDVFNDTDMKGLMRARYEMRRTRR
jgi:hypothetical protein